MGSRYRGTSLMKKHLPLGPYSVGEHLGPGVAPRLLPRLLLFIQLKVYFFSLFFIPLEPRVE